jgi:hypothetical protein
MEERMKTRMVLVILSLILLSGCAREEIIMTTPIVINYINSTVNETYIVEYNETVLPCIFTETYSLCQGLYTCNNGTATIMTRNQTQANELGCTI